MIDPNFWESEDVSRLSIFSRLLFIGLISNADDEGRGKANSIFLKSVIFPYDNIRIIEVDKALSEISHNTSIDFYELDGNKYYAFKNWSKWQNVSHPTKSAIKPLDSTFQSIRETFENNSRNIPPNIIEVNLIEDNICSEQTPTEILVISLILNDKTEYSVFQEQVSIWTELYPNVDILQELRNMKGWLISNPKKRKTRGGILRFINFWLAKRQNNGSKTETKNGYDGVKSL